MPDFASKPHRHKDCGRNSAIKLLVPYLHTIALDLINMDLSNKISTLNLPSKPEYRIKQHWQELPSFQCLNRQCQ